MLSLKYKDFKSQIIALTLTMRLVYVLICLVFSCASQKGPDKDIFILENNTFCPDDGKCTLEILQNKSLSLNRDGIGALYPNITIGDRMILKFE